MSIPYWPFILVLVIYFFYRLIKMSEQKNILSEKIKELELKNKELADEEARELRLSLIKEDGEIKSQLAFYKTSRLEEIEKDLETLKAQKDLELHYYKENQDRIIAELDSFLDNIVKEKEFEIDKVKDILSEYKEKASSINEVILREKKKREQEDYYRIVLSDDDIEDIENLSIISPKLHNTTALNKLLYEVYVRRPASEMIKRVLSGRAQCGVYKITFLKTGESYIGKSVDIGKRWNEHVKSAFGIGGIATSSLHTKMAREGVHNFSFEVIEETSREKLNEREKYYISFFETTSQLNMKNG